MLPLPLNRSKNMITIAIDDNLMPFSGPENAIAVSVGFFDGVHKGHRFLINQLKEIAAELNVPSAVITFPVHPRKILNSDYQPRLLNSFEEKMVQLSTTGVDYCFVVNFDQELANLTAKEFIQDKLALEFNARALIVGYDHKFGKNRQDGFNEYKQYGKDVGIDVYLAESFDQDQIHVSSTVIRNFLEEGRIKDAASFLTYNYILEGLVVNGNKLGREMGYPTANIQLFEKGKIIPKNGIYAVWVYWKDMKYKGMAYIGTRPSLFDQGEQRIEVHILDFNEELYNEVLVLEFVEFMRDDIKFDFVDDLSRQLSLDKKMADEILSCFT